MSATIVDRLYDDFRSLSAHLDSHAEPSLRITADETFRKTLLLAIASYFEIQIVGAIVKYISESANNNQLTTEFVKRKALNRQFHALFDWDANNANKFFSLFGDSFKVFMKDRLRSDDKLNGSVSAFIEVGRERNRLVHQDFGTYSLEKTSEEIFKLYQEATLFVDSLEPLLTDCVDKI